MLLGSFLNCKDKRNWSYTEHYYWLHFFWSDVIIFVHFQFDSSLELSEFSHQLPFCVITISNSSNQPICLDKNYMPGCPHSDSCFVLFCFFQSHSAVASLLYNAQYVYSVSVFWFQPKGPLSIFHKHKLFNTQGLGALFSIISYSGWTLRYSIIKVQNEATHFVESLTRLFQLILFLCEIQFQASCF